MNISSNHLFSNLFSKTVTFTKFLPKMREREFPWFPQCVRCDIVWNNEKFSITKKYFVKLVLYIVIYSFSKCPTENSPQCGKTRNSLSPKKIFRQINSLVNYLVKPLLSRNHCQKWVRENCRNFHWCDAEHTTVEIHFWQKLRESNIFTTKVIKNWFHEIYLFSVNT